MPTAHTAGPPVALTRSGEEEQEIPAMVRDAPCRWLPAGVAVAAIAGLLGWADTSLWDILRYGAYLIWGVVLPGTLLYRAARRTPHSLVDDLAMGAALGLALEIAAYTLFATAGLARWLVLWPRAEGRAAGHRPRRVPRLPVRPPRRHRRAGLAGPPG